jgi:hypothetical protein
MAAPTRYYPRNKNSFTDYDTGLVPLDMSIVRGDNTVNRNIASSSASFEDGMVADVDVSGHATGSGPTGFACSIKVPIVGITTEFRFLVQGIDSAGSIVFASNASATFNTSGTYTESVSAVWAAGLKFLRFIIQIRTTGVSASISVSVEDADTYCDGPWDYLSRREQCITELHNRLQDVQSLNETGTILKEDDENVAYPGAFLWAVSEIKEQRTTGKQGGRLQSELRLGIRIYVHDVNALNLLTPILKIIEVAVVEGPKNLGLSFVETVIPEEVIVAATSEEISGPIGLAEMVFLVRYNQPYGEP